MLKVKGIRRTTGEFEGKPFDNTYLHCMASPDSNTLCGELVEIVKVTTSKFNYICDNLAIDLSQLLGAKLRVFYDKYGRVDDFVLIQQVNKQEGGCFV